MAKLSSSTTMPRGRISAQTRTAQRTGTLQQQKKRVTVQTRRKLKRKIVNKHRGFWLW